jgi:membrane associated rhomboid family serine protease
MDGPRDPNEDGVRSVGVDETGPLDRETALRLLARADELFEAGQFEEAGRYYQRVYGFDDPPITASALYGLGNALFRLDREDVALTVWEQILKLPETPSTYLAWRQIAALRVREGDLNGALTAYREADRRAPAADKAEIASRLGWLAKETGDKRGAARAFRRSRGSTTPVVTYLIIAITVIVSLTAWAGLSVTRSGVDYGPIYPALWLDKAAVADGQLWRLVTVTLVHAPDPTFMFIHLGFNMYALYLVGPVVETIYGPARMALMYVLTAIAGSTASFVFVPQGQSVGASGAVFGLFGILLVASRVHHPMLDRRGRAISAQVGTLILINLAFGFGLGGGAIDNAAHVGGLLGGMWLALILLPPGAPTLARMWQQPTDSRPALWRASPLLQAIGVAALALVLAVGLIVGSGAYRHGGAASADPHQATAAESLGARTSA